MSRHVWVSHLLMSICLNSPLPLQIWLTRAGMNMTCGVDWSHKYDWVRLDKIWLVAMDWWRRLRGLQRSLTGYVYTNLASRHHLCTITVKSSRNFLKLIACPPRAMMLLPFFYVAVIRFVALFTIAHFPLPKIPGCPIFRCLFPLPFLPFTRNCAAHFAKCAEWQIARNTTILSTTQNIILYLRYTPIQRRRSHSGKTQRRYNRELHIRYNNF